ncbi:Starch binding domain containing protein [Trichomonas vaginalis G3]|uniref:4-alpha-glucanotransferase n=1 Tax=Trichomonas vaginalis (strain ATCC PRA-98 / G3) TaxID=412133 RepID=A2EFJ7_TRIV3|nr:heteropolysaccharide binding [Trichomonas vaginalis G3]EAY08591.1 Starch binding domain containing protein [Trichomonas vaginalis G3]KAI5497892.1 heteropolysaccharide binding [Trichomonas vaginalis G3]|eukprot:XP_001320814.1 Starch binding domain containing protein [Trichomonas vaginalis G3]
MSTSKTSVTFFCKAQYAFGERLCIFGNTPELGDGDIKKAIYLDWIEGSYNNRLTVSFAQLPAGKWYKYAIVDSYGNVRYESIPDRIIPKFFDAVALRDTFNLPAVTDSVILSIRVPYGTYWGQNIYVIGDCEELGDWQINNAFPLSYIDHQYWGGSVRFPISNEARQVKYRYFIQNDNAKTIWEPGDEHTVIIPESHNPSIIEIVDPYRWTDSIIETISRSPFTKAFNPREASSKGILIQSNENPDTVRIQFSILCPVPRQGQVMKIAGSIKELGYWNPPNALELQDHDFPTWTQVVDVPTSSLPFEYKYILCDQFGNVIWESRSNRFLFPTDVKGLDSSYPINLICHDWIPSIGTNPFRGLCIHVDLPNIWTKKTCGCGQFGDVCRVIDFASQCGASMIQLTSVYDEKRAFALDLAYVDLNNIPDITDDVITLISNHSADITDQDVNLEETRSFKIDALRQIYKHQQFHSDFTFYAEQNKDWLPHYAKYLGETDVKFVQWTQYIADKQLREVTAYALERRIAMRGEIQPSVQLDSCDIRAFPHAFTGFEEVVDDEKQGSLSFSWTKECQQWWKRRLEIHERYFQSLRVKDADKIVQVGEVPPQMAINAMHLSTDKSLSEQELKDMKLWDIKRYVTPYLRSKLLPPIFGDDTNYIEKKYFNVRGRGFRDKLLSFKMQSLDEVEEKYRSKMQALLSDVVMTESLGRFFFVNTLGNSWKDLPQPQRRIIQRITNEKLMSLKGQDAIEESARARTRMISRQTELEVVGEDGEFYTEFTPERSQIKTRGGRFTDTRNLSFMFVSTMGSSIMRWWRDNREEAQKFWREELYRQDECPLELPTWALENIINMQLQCGAQWVVIPLDDIAAIGGHINKKGGREPFPVENLVEDRNLSAKMSSFVNQSGRRI